MSLFRRRRKKHKIVRVRYWVKMPETQERIAYRERRTHTYCSRCFLKSPDPTTECPGEAP